MSQIGGSGYFWGAIDWTLNYPKLKTLYVISSLLTATAFALFILWYTIEFGLLTGLITFASTLFSPWITVFSKNLYWVPWMWFLPTLFLAFLFRSEEKRARINRKLLIFGVFFLIFLKSACGYEYLSTILISMTAPLFYYAIKNSWSIRESVNRIISVSSAGILGFISAVALDALVRAKSPNNWIHGFEAIVSDVRRRTYGNPEEFNLIYRESLTTPWWKVLKLYFEGIAYANMTYGSFITMFCIAALIGITLPITLPQRLRKEQYFKLKGLIVALTVSFFGPVSWFIIAKGHSFTHTHLNFILWHLSFMFFGFALIGYIIQASISSVLKNKFSSKNFYHRILLRMLHALRRLTTLVRCSHWRSTSAPENGKRSITPF